MVDVNFGFDSGKFAQAVTMTPASQAAGALLLTVHIKKLVFNSPSCFAGADVCI